MKEAAAQTGWKMPRQAYKWHYFRGMQSLCSRYMLPSFWTPITNPPKEQRCKKCQGILDREAKADAEQSNDRQ